MTVNANVFVREDTVVTLEREPSYTAISIRNPQRVGSQAVLFFASEEVLQKFIAVINANKDVEEV
jgi:hypothetical protein